MSMADCKSCDARILFQDEISELKTNYAWVRKAIEAIEGSTKEIAESSRAMVKLEAEGNETRAALSRAFHALEREEVERKMADHDLISKIESGFDKLDRRLGEIEREMPTLTLARTCVFAVIAMALTNFVGIVWVVMKAGIL